MLDVTRARMIAQKRQTIHSPRDTRQDTSTNSTLYPETHRHASCQFPRVGPHPLNLDRFLRTKTHAPASPESPAQPLMLRAIAHLAMYDERTVDARVLADEVVVSLLDDLATRDDCNLVSVPNRRQTCAMTIVVRLCFAMISSSAVAQCAH